MKRDKGLLLGDILESAKLIQKYSSGIEDFTYLNPISMEFDAIIWRFIVIGEAASRLSNSFKSKYKNVDWIGIRGFRNFIVHEYEMVDIKELENSIKVDIPELISQIEEIIRKESNLKN